MCLNCNRHKITPQTYIHAHRRYRSTNIQEKRSSLNFHFKLAYQLCRSRRLGMLCVLVCIYLALIMLLVPKQILSTPCMSGTPWIQPELRSGQLEQVVSPRVTSTLRPGSCSFASRFAFSNFSKGEGPN